MERIHKSSRLREGDVVELCWRKENWRVILRISFVMREKRRMILFGEIIQSIFLKNSMRKFSSFWVKYRRGSVSGWKFNKEEALVFSL